MSLPVLGIDIAKQKIEVTLFVTDKVKNKSFNNSPDGFQGLAAWLRKWGMERVHACLEATGNYGEDLAIFLHEAGHIVSIVNPARIKGFAQSVLVRTKTDKVDASLIARFCLAMKPGPWVPPSAEIRALRALIRRADSLIDMLTQEKNRLDTAHESVIPLIKGPINYLEMENEKIRDQIADLIDRNPDLKRKKDLLGSIPGIGKATIATLLAELDDLEKFKRVGELVAFIGLGQRKPYPDPPLKGNPGCAKRVMQKSAIHASAGLDSIQSFDDYFLPASQRKREEWKGYRMCGYAKTGPCYFWSPKIREKIRSKL